MATQLTPQTQEARRAAVWVSVATIVYNLLEGVLSIAFSVRDDSAALLGFGVDSFIESLSASIILWRFWRPELDQRRERPAIRMVGVSLLVLAAYVAYDAWIALKENESVVRSIAAQLIAIASLVVMPGLFLAKRRIARTTHSRALLADARQTLACMVLSVALLVGAGLDYWLGIRQADSLAALIISALLALEGVRTWVSGEACGC